MARARLAALDLTQSALAIICELDVRTVQRWFAGQPVRFEEAERVAAALRIGTADLFSGVPEHGGHGGVFELLAAMCRLPLVRDHPSAQVIRSVPSHFGEFLAPVSFRSHPLHGYTHPFALARDAAQGFSAFRVQGATSHETLRISIRLAPSVLVERAQVLVRDEHAWLVETHMSRSMRAPRRADGSFDVWYWVGHEASELLFAAESTLSVEALGSPLADRTIFDMASPEAAHAVCIRPAVTQLASAGLARGFDRVLHRDVSRVEVPEPGRYVSGLQPRTTPG